MLDIFLAAAAEQINTDRKTNDPSCGDKEKALKGYIWSGVSLGIPVWRGCSRN